MKKSSRAIFLSVRRTAVVTTKEYNSFLSKRSGGVQHLLTRAKRAQGHVVMKHSEADPLSTTEVASGLRPVQLYRLQKLTSDCRKNILWVPASMPAHLQK